jgi:hypothetical protein
VIKRSASSRRDESTKKECGLNTSKILSWQNTAKNEWIPELHRITTFYTTDE